MGKSDFLTFTIEFIVQHIFQIINNSLFIYKEDKFFAHRDYSKNIDWLKIKIHNFCTIINLGNFTEFHNNLIKIVDLFLMS